uniref:Uncharacterized protein n=1 Tax=Arundo donax TaxID=35708 RepID=A0A0A9F7D9_ARUDO
MVLLCTFSLLQDSGKRNPGRTVLLISSADHCQRRGKILRWAACCRRLHCQMSL